MGINGRFCSDKSQMMKTAIVPKMLQVAYQIEIINLFLSTYTILSFLLNEITTIHLKGSSSLYLHVQVSHFSISRIESFSIDNDKQHTVETVVG